MTDREILCRAKEYVDKLANGIDPLTDSPVNENDIVNNIRISRCLFYVSNVLNRVIANGVHLKKKYISKQSFSLSKEDLKKLEYYDDPVPITKFLRNINALINENIMKKLSYKSVQAWLVKVGLLENANGKYGNSKLCPTELGNQMGISIKERVNSYNSSYFVIYYDRNAQEFIVANLREIKNLN